MLAPSAIDFQRPARPKDCTHDWSPGDGGPRDSICVFSRGETKNDGHRLEVRDATNSSTARSSCNAKPTLHCNGPTIRHTLGLAGPLGCDRLLSGLN